MGLLDQQTRRQFCGRACSAAAIAALGGAVATVLQSCSSGSPTSPSGTNASPLPLVSGTASGGTVAITIDASSPLASVGSVALAQSSAGNYLVARTAQDTFVALTATCTHQACQITGHSGQIFVCPCHGSQFDSSGRVLSGPAPTALRQYPTRFTDNVLTIG